MNEVISQFNSRTKQLTAVFLICLGLFMASIIYLHFSLNNSLNKLPNQLFTILTGTLNKELTKQKQEIEEVLINQKDKKSAYKKQKDGYKNKQGGKTYKTTRKNKEERSKLEIVNNIKVELNELSVKDSLLYSYYQNYSTLFTAIGIFITFLIAVFGIFQFFSLNDMRETIKALNLEATAKLKKAEEVEKMIQDGKQTMQELKTVKESAEVELQNINEAIKKVEKVETLINEFEADFKSLHDIKIITTFLFSMLENGSFDRAKEEINKIFTIISKINNKIRKRDAYDGFFNEVSKIMAQNNVKAKDIYFKAIKPNLTKEAKLFSQTLVGALIKITTLKEYEEALRISEENFTETNALEEFIHLFITYIKVGKFKEATKLLKSNINIFPTEEMYGLKEYIAKNIENEEIKKGLIEIIDQSLNNAN